MKFSDEINKALTTQRQKNDVTVEESPEGEGYVVKSFFRGGKLLGKVRFPDTPETRQEFQRAMTEAMNPGTDAGAGNYQTPD